MTFSLQIPSERYTIEDLKAIMIALRDPQKGCPWDVKQTFETICKYTIEEAYEVVEAIETGDRDGLQDELGDLLFQVVYHAEMAREEGSFAFDDVVHRISEKLIRRHPHVFGDETLSSDIEIRGMWERIKAEEKLQKTAKGCEEKGDLPSLLQDVSVGLPGLSRAVKLQKKAASVGFDWPEVAQVVAKLQEELDELKEALLDDGSLAAQAHQQEEFGDLLFVMANLARHLDIDPETAIREANAKFCRRFAFIEAAYDHNRAAMNAAPLEEMDALWDEAKRLQTSNTEDVD